LKRQLSIASRLPVGQAREQHREAVAKERACQETADELKAALAEARAALVLAAAERRRAEDDLESAEAIEEGGTDSREEKGEGSGDPLFGGRA
jgi:multidrug resistance efflux pump